MPVGTVIIWPSAILPTDGTWLECNGQATAAYPELAAIVGATVPDYRGYFLRGYGGNSLGIGVTQGDAIRNITGGVYGSVEEKGSSAYGAFGIVAISTPGPSASLKNIGFDFDASRVVPTAAENRPINKAVYYLIKAK